MGEEGRDFKGGNKEVGNPPREVVGSKGMFPTVRNSKCMKAQPPNLWKEPKKLSIAKTNPGDVLDFEILLLGNTIYSHTK